ncbi:NUDIX hydrolase [Halorussus halobius]|uniref:NUDIX hydrolase n=1 Tax=Halorussus halobius TaxID=1710537 RepID=UPI001091ECFE|nr:NUDIX hydrolase [Halorussus halobius]
MVVADPRQQYDDLFEKCIEEEVDEETFGALEENEAFSAGWAVSAVVVDDSERVLLAYHGGDGSWLLPGGSVQPGESLRDATVREVREETGVSVKPDRPYAVVENIVQHGEDSRSFTFVLFSAHAITTEIGSELGTPDEPIEDADWFDDLPDNVFKREIAERVLERVRQGE